jgi:hypothetical protein
MLLPPHPHPHPATPTLQVKRVLREHPFPASKKHLVKVICLILVTIHMLMFLPCR